MYVCSVLTFELISSKADCLMWNCTFFWVVKKPGSPENLKIQTASPKTHNQKCNYDNYNKYFQTRFHVDFSIYLFVNAFSETITYCYDSMWLMWLRLHTTIQKSKNKKDFARKLQVICVNWNLCKKLHLKKSKKIHFMCSWLVAYGLVGICSYSRCWFVDVVDLQFTITFCIEHWTTLSLADLAIWIYCMNWIEIAFFWPIDLVCLLLLNKQKYYFEYSNFICLMFMNMIYRCCTHENQIPKFNNNKAQRSRLTSCRTQLYIVIIWFVKTLHSSLKSETDRCNCTILK